MISALHVEARDIGQGTAERLNQQNTERKVDTGASLATTSINP